MPERGDRGGLGEGGQVVRQADESEGIDHRRVGSQVADAGAGERERLAHRAGHDQARSSGQQGDRARGIVGHELRVGLVDHDDAVRRVVGGADRLDVERGARGVVRAAEEHDVRTVLGDGRDHRLRGDAELVVALRRDPPRAGAGGEDRVHRVGGREAEHRAARAAEGLEELLEDLVGPVRRPELLRGQLLVRREAAVQVRGQRPTQLGELAVRVPVDGGQGLPDRGHDVLGDVLGHGMRVLVDVELHAHVLLRSAVGALPTEVVADREVFERGCHRSIVGRAPCAATGRPDGGPCSRAPRAALGRSVGQGPPGWGLRSVARRVLRGDGDLLAGLQRGPVQRVEAHDVLHEVARVGLGRGLLGELPERLARLDGHGVEVHGLAGAGGVSGRGLTAVEHGQGDDHEDRERDERRQDDAAAARDAQARTDGGRRGALVSDGDGAHVVLAFPFGGTEVVYRT
ncbi:hypothetical protein Cus16_3130 [Curtobacterium sp. ER1/6]|nr:hypothetical protein Cus16_3130 [Curtobacterium sp. ER1/6]